MKLDDYDVIALLILKMNDWGTPSAPICFGPWLRKKTLAVLSALLRTCSGKTSLPYYASERHPTTWILLTYTGMHLFAQWRPLLLGIRFVFHWRNYTIISCANVELSYCVFYLIDLLASCCKRVAQDRSLDPEGVEGHSSQVKKSCFLSTCMVGTYLTSFLLSFFPNEQIIFHGCITSKMLRRWRNLWAWKKLSISLRSTIHSRT